MGFLLFIALIFADCRQFFSDINKAYQEKVTNSLVEESSFFDRPYAQVLGEGYDLGHSHPQILVKLGFTVSKDANGKTILIAPNNFDVIVRNSHREIEKLIQSGKINREEAIYPAVLFINPKRNIVQDGELISEYKYVRLGLEPVPEGDWVFESHPGLDSHKKFYRAIDEGKMPIGVGDAFFHDLAHYTDLLENPENMKQWRSYAKNLIHKESPGFIRSLFNFSENKKQYLSESRSLILAENFALPDINKKDKIKALIPHYFDNSLKISETEKKKHYKNLIDKTDEVLGRFGGAMRDYVNIEALDDSHHILGRINSELNKSWVRDSIKSIDEIAVSMAESLMGLKREIAMAYDLRYHFEEADQRLQKELLSKSDVNLYFALKRINKISAEKRNAQLDKILKEKVERLERALYTAVKLEIDIETVYKEARVNPPAPGSKTYEYLKSYLVPGSFSYKAFELR